MLPFRPMSEAPRLPRKPEARTEKVEDLVSKVLRGLVRVPHFQRGLKWGSSDVVKLFDSIYRGYPIGSLLFSKGPAESTRLTVGPLPVDAPETPEAWWVVDGQQRVTALTAGLAHPLPLPERPDRKDPYVVFFDAPNQRFAQPPNTGKIPSTWVPLPKLLDASQLTEWVFQWPHAHDEPLRRLVFQAGARIREYAVPLYLIETEAAKEAEEIFYRINQTGKRLEWTDVHKALFGVATPSPATLNELARALEDVGMGRLGEDRLLTCLLALRGLDPTRSLGEHYDQDADALRGAVQEALPVLRRVLSFLRQDAAILHLRLLPKSILLDILTRFFSLHPDPNPRSRTLLSRWLWRTILGAGAVDDRTLRRRGIAAIEPEREEESVQNLLVLTRREPPRSYELPAAFDARADDSRIALLALAHLSPRDLLTGKPIDLPAILEREGRETFAKIVEPSPASPPRARGPENRLLLEPSRDLQRLLCHCFDGGAENEAILRSHAFDAGDATAFFTGDEEKLLAKRADRLAGEARRLGDRLAAWAQSDRPSLAYLLAEHEVAV